MIKVELRKSLTSTTFKIAVLLGLFLSVAAAIDAISKEFYVWEIWDKYWINPDGSMNKDPLIPVSTLYKAWLGGNRSPFSLGFYYLLPLLSTLPFSWSLASEKVSGYRKQIIVRCGRMKYYFAKGLSAFASGSLAVLIPLIINYIIVACFVPARLPDPHYCIYYGVDMQSFCSMLFYTRPLLYDIMIILIDSVFAGLWAVFCLSLGFFVKRSATVIIVPYIALLVYAFIVRLFGNTLHLELSPFNFLQGYQAGGDVKGFVLFATLGLLALAFCGICRIRGKKDNVF